MLCWGCVLYTNKQTESPKAWQSNIICRTMSYAAYAFLSVCVCVLCKKWDSLIISAKAYKNVFTTFVVVATLLLFKKSILIELNFCSCWYEKYAIETKRRVILKKTYSSRNKTAFSAMEPFALRFVKLVIEEWKCFFGFLFSWLWFG